MLILIRIRYFRNDVFDSKLNKAGKKHRVYMKKLNLSIYYFVVLKKVFVVKMYYLYLHFMNLTVKRIAYLLINENWICNRKFFDKWI